MTLRKVTIGSLGILGLSALITAAALVKTAGFSALLSGFSLLAFTPYAVLGGACFLAGNSRGRAIAIFIVCVLTTGCAIFLYGDLVLLNPGSMSGLVFILVPFYQLAVGILLVIIVSFMRWRSRCNASA